jgi:hypothetical protein
MIRCLSLLLLVQQAGNEAYTSYKSALCKLEKRMSEGMRGKLVERERRKEVVM